VSEFPDAMRVVDSHTEGEPTRVVIEGWPDPAGTTMAQRRDDMRRRFDHLRSAVVCEPRGHAAVVGALLTAPVTPGAVAGVVFFNNVGYLGMCGHGLIGVVRTLEYLGRLERGVATLDTPVGTVAAQLDGDGAVTITNVPARCHMLDVAVDVPGVGALVGDVAYGGNWFFISHFDRVPLDLDHEPELMRVSAATMQALRAQHITGAEGADIDHVEFSAAPRRADADSRNFVLCPGGAYDRSPCGTGTSARMAALHARGELTPGQRWRQESVTGGLFTGWLEERAGKLLPHIQGRAFVTAESTLRFDPLDPFRAGFPSA
jgi:4-hydroxyproline epimerase